MLWRSSRRTRHSITISARPCAHGKRVDEAIAAYYRALNFDPAFANAYTSIGILCLTRNRLPEAADVLRRATAYRPTDGAAYARLGAAHAERGELDEALTAFARAIRFEPGNTVYFQHFVQALNAYPFPSMPSGLIMELRTCFDLDNIAHQALVPRSDRRSQERRAVRRASGDDR